MLFFRSIIRIILKAGVFSSHLVGKAFPLTCLSGLLIAHSHQSIHHLKKTYLDDCDEKRAFLFPSLYGSITLECSLVLPLFLIFGVQLISIIGLIGLHSRVEAALHQEVSKLTVNSYAYAKAGISGDGMLSSLVSDTFLRTAIIKDIGSDYLNHSMVKGGSNGLRISRGNPFGEEQDIIDVVVSYHVSPMIPLLGFDSFVMSNRCRMKPWTGYIPNGFHTDQTDTTMEEMVYVTEYGVVYHRSLSCSHLKLNIRTSNVDNAKGQRNEYGEKYHACEYCGSGASGLVYLTTDGNRYHTSLNCTGLKRSISSLPLSQVGGKRPCSKCGGG